ncbi:MAG: MmgE/PrpD family protein, partial [Pseudomonadota bacterium]
GADAGQTAHALSVSVSQAIGYTLQIGSNAKPLQTGWAARNGLEAVLLAMQGISGQLGVLDHARGFAGLLGEYDAERFDQVMGRLGTPWALTTYGLVLKPWPSCGYTHRLMTAALELRPSMADRLSEVARIETTLPDFHAEILQFEAPATRADALFSIPACVAQILVTGNLTLEDSAQAFWTQARVARLMSLTDVEVERAKAPDLNYDPDQPDRVRVTFQNGDVLEATCAYPLGASQNPMPPDQLGAKFAALTGHTEAAFSTLLGWPQSADIAAFFKGYDNGTA